MVIVSKGEMVRKGWGFHIAALVNRVGRSV